MHFQEKEAFATLGEFISFQNEEKANNLILSGVVQCG